MISLAIDKRKWQDECFKESNWSVVGGGYAALNFCSEIDGFGSSDSHLTTATTTKRQPGSAVDATRRRCDGWKSFRIGRPEMDCGG